MERGFKKMKVFTVTWNIGNALKFKEFNSYETAKKFALKKAQDNPTTCIIIKDGNNTTFERF